MFKKKRSSVNYQVAIISTAHKEEQGCQTMALECGCRTRWALWGPFGSHCTHSAEGLTGLRNHCSPLLASQAPPVSHKDFCKGDSGADRTLLGLTRWLRLRDGVLLSPETHSHSCGPSECCSDCHNDTHNDFTPLPGPHVLLTPVSSS